MNLKLMNLKFLLLLFFFHLPLAFAAPKIVEGLSLDGVKAGSLQKILALSPDDLVFADHLTVLSVKKGEMLVHDLKASKASSKKPIKLPAGCHRLALVQEGTSYSRSVYCFGGEGKKGFMKVYSGKGKFKTIIKTPRKVSAMSGGQNRLFFILGDTLYQVRAHEGVKLVFTASLLNGVHSMAFDPEKDTLFLATSDSILTLRAGVLDILVQGLGGRIFLNGDELIVMTSKKKLYQISGLSKLLSAKK